MDYDVYLYDDSSDEAVAEGSDHLWRGLEYQEAIDCAREQVVSGFYARAIVGQGEDVHEVYDTAHDAGLLGGPPLPAIAPAGPRQRLSSLAERKLVGSLV
jgi:hypothetical protein